MDLLSRVNVDLLGPLLIVFALLRLKNHYCVPLKLLSGLRFFVSNITLSQKHLRAPQSASSIKEQSIIDKKLNEFNLSMIELDGSVRKGSILSGLMMYDTYETLIYISLSSVAVHFFSSVFHCFSPTSMYSIWGTIFVTMSVILPFRALMRILFLTGFEAFESRISLIACAFIFMLSAALLFGPLDVLGLAFDDVLSITAIHFNALLLQLSHTAPQLSEHVMVAMIKVVLSALTAMTAVGMVIPAMRFSQSFNTLLFGARYERATLKMRAMLVFDHLMPLIVAASMIPSSLGIPTSLRTDGFLLAMQLTTTFLMVVVRLHCLRKHLQCFLGAIVQAISIEIATNASTDAKKIQVSDPSTHQLEVCVSVSP